MSEDPILNEHEKETLRYYEELYAEGDYHTLCHVYCHESYGFEDAGEGKIVLCNCGLSVPVEGLPPGWNITKLENAREKPKHWKDCGRPVGWPPAAMEALKALATKIIEQVRKNRWLGC